MTLAQDENRNAFGIIECSPEGRSSEGQDTTPYTRLVVDLSIARANEFVSFAGSSVVVEKLEGEMSFAPNQSAELLPLSIYTQINVEFTPGFYLTNSAQAGASATLLVFKSGSVTVVSPSDENIVSSDYSNQSISLTGARTDEDISSTLKISNDQPALGFTVVSFTGAADTTSVRLNYVTADPITLVGNMELTNMRFTSLFLTNTAQAGLVVILFIPKG